MNVCKPLCTVGCIDAVTWARYDGAELVREERRVYPDGSVAPPSFGIVQYVPGLSIDAPLAAIRDGSALYVLTPHWRGRAESSVNASGADAVSRWWDGHKDKVIMAVGMVLTEGRSEWEGLTPATLRGKSMQEVDDMVPQSWARQPTARGEGTRYVHPTNRGEQLRVQPGMASDPNPVKQGPYCRISQCGETTEPIPLKGNPTLPPQE